MTFTTGCWIANLFTSFRSPPTLLTVQFTEKPVGITTVLESLNDHYGCFVRRNGFLAFRASQGLLNGLNQFHSVFLFLVSATSFPKLKQKVWGGIPQDRGNAISSLP
jgi:hypothetical protein